MIVATQYTFSEQKEQERGVHTEEERLAHMDLSKNEMRKHFRRMNENCQNMDMVFIDSYYNLTNPTERMMFINQTNNLLKFAKETKPFPMRDIETVQIELREMKEEWTKISEAKTILDKKFEDLPKDFRTQLDICNKIHAELKKQKEDLSLKLQLEEQVGGNGANLAFVGGASLILGLLLAGTIWTWRRLRSKRLG